LATEPEQLASRSDYFSIDSIYVPLWVLLGSFLGLVGVGSINALIEGVWITASVVVALMAWRTGARQVHRERLADQQAKDIKNSLGKLVSVTEPSPSNVIAAAAAKILDLEKQLKDIQQDSPRSISAEQWDAMSSILRELPSRVPHIIVLFREEYFESARYAREFVSLFQFHDIGGAILPNPIPPLTADVNGLVLRYDSSQQKPDIITRLSRALTLAHIDHHEEAVPFPADLKGNCQLVVGKKINHKPL
jgi:hypothetical protein